MLEYARPLARLVNELNKLPGVGPRTAERLAFHLLSVPREEAASLAEALLEARDKVKDCRICGNLTGGEDVCVICSSAKRDASVICVVEETRDLLAMEKTREFRGFYHVLQGVISPAKGSGPDNLKIKELLERTKGGTVQEVIIATNPSVEGEATAHYLARLLKPFVHKVSRLAYGMPAGGDLEYADQITLARALEGRREIS